MKLTLRPVLCLLQYLKIKMFCKYCNKEVKIEGLGNSLNHVKKCKKQNGFYEKSLEELNKKDKEWYYEKFIIEGLSLKEMLTLFQYSNTRQLKKYLSKIGIDKTKEQRYNSKSRMSKMKQTNIKKYGVEFLTFDRKKMTDGVKKKYGVDNVFKSVLIKEKIKKTNLEKYGNEHPTKLPEFKQKVENTCLKKYGYTNVRKSPEYIQKMLRSKQKNGYCFGFVSKTSQIFFEKLYSYLPNNFKNESFYFKKDGAEFAKYDSENKKLYMYDFVLKNSKICIEYNGDYWHCNPSIYNEDYFNKYTNKTAKEIWIHDEKKCSFLESLGFKVIIVWESEVNAQFDFKKFITNNLFCIY